MPPRKRTESSFRGWENVPAIFSPTLNPAMFGRAAALVNVAGGGGLSARIGSQSTGQTRNFQGGAPAQRDVHSGARATTGKSEPDWSVRRISRRSAGWEKMACEESAD